MGAIPDRLRFGPTLATQVGSSFVSKLAPAGLGGMALNVRFAQKSGVDSAVAVSGVGLNSVGGFAMLIVLLAVFVVWAGREAFGDFEPPDPRYFVYGIVVVAILSGVSFAFPAVRKLVLGKLVPILRRSAGGIRAVLANPVKLVLLIVGSMEAALLAGLRAAGMASAVALPAVFLFRLGTFWLPILPGWAAFTWLKRSEHI